MTGKFKPNEDGLNRYQKLIFHTVRVKKSDTTRQKCYFEFVLDVVIQYYFPYKL